MESKFIIFVVLVTVTHSSLAGLLNLENVLGALTSIIGGTKKENGNSHTKKPLDPSKVKPHHQHPEVFSKIEVARHLTRCAARATTTLAFRTMDFEICTAANETQTECGPGSTLIQIAEAKQYIDYKSGMNAYFDTMLIAQPEATLTVRDARPAAISALRSCISHTNDGIELISNKNCTNIVTVVEKILKKVLPARVNVTNNIYVGILNGRDSTCEIGAKISKAKQKTVQLAIAVIVDLFNGIKCALTKICGVHFEGSDCPSSIGPLKDKAVATNMALVDSVYAAIVTSCEAPSEEPTTDDYGHY